MLEFLTQVENTRFCTWVRESGSLWGFPGFLYLHTVGLTFLVGPTVAIDLRLIGFARRLSVASMEKLYRITWAGFWINAATGVVLLAADATTKLFNPTFYVKMAFIALGVTTMVLVRRKVFRHPDLDKEIVPPMGKLLAFASILCWAGAITAGRLMAYIGPSSGSRPLGP